MVRARALLVLLMLPVAAVVWLGWRIAVMDLDAQRQRVLERREQVADRVVESLSDLCRNINAQLQSGEAGMKLGDHGVSVQIDESGLRTSSAPLLYAPMPPPNDQDDPFEAAETIEFQHDRPLEAANLLRSLTKNSEPGVRAGALTRLGRNLVKAGRFEEAKRTYQELRAYAGISLDGLPAELLSLRALAGLYERTGRKEEFLTEATLLADALQSAKWRLSRASYEHLDSDVRHWLRRPASEPASEALAAAVDWVWRTGVPAGQTVVWPGGIPVSTFWQTKSGQLRVVAAHNTLLTQRGILTEPAGVRLALTDREGRPVHGLVGPSHITRDPSTTNLPWRVHVSTIAPTTPALSQQTSLLLAALALMLVTVAFGATFGIAAMRRELAATKREAEFVAAVSHEFRTPVTSLRSMSELLARGRVSEDRRELFYESMVQQTRRLQRLVEGLLRFGKLEAARGKIPFDPLDLDRLLREIVTLLDAEGRTEVNIEAGLPLIYGDADALVTVFSNILDNALKYSPRDARVWLDARRLRGEVEVRIRDVGAGIAQEEEEAIFRRFQRGSAARAGETEGSGLGLSLAQQIVKAHHGRIAVESEKGTGTVFTVSLPVSTAN